MKKVLMAVVMLSVVGSAGVVLACSSCGCQGAKAHDDADAQHVHSDAVAPLAAATEATAPVNAGNKVCPIMGMPVSEDSPDKVEYQGKLYNLCCAGCKDAFLKDPEAALKKLAEAEEASAEAKK